MQRGGGSVWHSLSFGGIKIESSVLDCDYFIKNVSKFTAQSKQKTTADVFPIASNFICANAAATTVNGSRNESVNGSIEARNHHA